MPIHQAIFAALYAAPAMIHAKEMSRTRRDEDDEVKSQYTLSECLTEDTGDTKLRAQGPELKFHDYVSCPDIIMQDIDYMLSLIGGAAGFMHDANSRNVTPKYVLDLFAREKLITEPFEEHRRYLVTAAVFLIRIQICLGMVLPMATYTHPLLALLLPLDFDDLRPSEDCVYRIFNARLHRPFRITPDLASIHKRKHREWSPLADSHLFADATLSPTLDTFGRTLACALGSVQGALNMLHAYRHAPSKTHRPVSQHTIIIEHARLALDTATSVYAYNPDIRRVLDTTCIRHAQEHSRAPKVTIPSALLHSSVPVFLHSGLLAVHTDAHWKENRACKSDRTLYEDSLMNHPGIADPNRVSRVFTAYRELWLSPFTLLCRPQTYFAWTVAQQCLVLVACITGVLPGHVVLPLHFAGLLHEYASHAHAPRVSVLDTCLILEIVFCGTFMTYAWIVSLHCRFVHYAANAALAMRVVMLVPYGQQVILSAVADLMNLWHQLPRYVLPAIALATSLIVFPDTSPLNYAHIAAFTTIGIWFLNTVPTTRSPLPACFVFTRHRFIDQCYRRELSGIFGFIQSVLYFLCVPRAITYSLGTFFPTLACIPVLSFVWMVDMLLLLTRTLVYQFRIAWSIRDEPTRHNTQIIPFMIPFMWALWSVSWTQRAAGILLCVLLVLIYPVFILACMTLGPVITLCHSFTRTRKSIPHRHKSPQADEAFAHEANRSDRSIEITTLSMAMI